MRSQVHEDAWWPARLSGLGPIFNAANDALEQALSKNESRGAGRDIG
jgi:hypothetical protein